MKKFNLLKLFPTFVLILTVGCSPNTNDPEFLNKIEGRYLFTADETVNVYSKDNMVLLEWRGADAIKPSKINDDIFYVKEMNAKIKFLTNPEDQKEYLVFLPKNKDDKIEYIHKKLSVEEKTPSEYLANSEFEKALEGYQAIQAKDSMSPLLNWWEFDRKGRRYQDIDSLELAMGIFKINAVLHPKEPDVYVRLGRAYLTSKDTVNALTNYKKALEFDSGNRRLKERIEELQGKEAENTN